MITVAVSQTDLIRLFKGTPISPKIIEKYGHMVEFTGNQWNEQYSWISTKLYQLTEDELYEMYCNVKDLTF